METRKRSVKVIDADAHILDFDEMIKPYMAEPFRARRFLYHPLKMYDRTLGGTLSHRGVRHEEWLSAMNQQEIHFAVLIWQRDERGSVAGGEEEYLKEQ